MILRLLLILLLAFPPHTIAASEIDSGGDINLNAPGGQVSLLTRKDTAFEQETRSSESPLWVKATDKGREIEEIRHTLLTGEGDLNIVTANGVIVEYEKTGDLDRSIDQLSQAPGLAWMAELRDDPNIDWRAVEAVQREWSESHEGLGAPAAAVIAIAITIATQGMGAGFIGAAGTTTTTTAATATAAATTTTTFTTAGVMANAGFSALVSQAGVSLISNKGNLGAVFDELASASTVRSLAASVLTAGLLKGADVSNLDVSGDFFAQEAVLANLQDQLIAAGIRSGVDSAITGADLGDSLKTNLRLAGAAVLGAQLSQEIGASFRTGDIDRSVQLIAHAATGCAVGAVGTGNCGAGTAGQLAGEISALLYSGGMSQAEIAQQTQEWQERGVDIARLSGALAAALAGGDADDINMASDAGGTAAANNALCGGLCVTAAATILLSTAYAAYEGGGNPVEGLRIIGRGEDDLSRAIESVFDTATDGIGYVGANYLPEATEGAAGYIILAGQAGSDTITFIDEASGKRISTTYDKIPLEAREIIMGVVTTGSYAVGGVSTVSKITGKVASTLNIAAKGGVVAEVGLVSKIDNYFGQDRKFWSSDPIEFNGNKVYQRNDLFDLSRVDDRNRSNLERMQKGLAPIGKDGESINLHHMLQTQDGPIAEVTQTFHQQNTKALHINSGSGIPSGIDRNVFDAWKKQYWKNRAKDFE